MVDCAEVGIRKPENINNEKIVIANTNNRNRFFILRPFDFESFILNDIDHRPAWGFFYFDAGGKSILKRFDMGDY